MMIFIKNIVNNKIQINNYFFFTFVLLIFFFINLFLLNYSDFFFILSENIVFKNLFKDNKDLLTNSKLNLNLISEFYTSLIILTIFCYSLKFIKISKKIKFNLLVIFILKYLIMLFLGTVYEVYNNNILDQHIFNLLADSDYKLFSSYKHDYSYMVTNFNNNFFIIFIKILKFFSLNSIFVLKTIFIYFNIITLFFFIKIFNIYSKKNTIILLYILAFVPSVIYSTSVLSKDTIILLILSIFFYFFLNNFTSHKKKLDMKTIIILFFCLLLLLSLRIPIGVIIISTIFIFFYLSFLMMNKEINFYKVLSFATPFLLGIFFIKEYEFQNFIFSNFERINNIHQGKMISNDITNFFDLLKNLPLLYFYSIFNPFVEQVGNYKAILFILENLIIIIFLLFNLKNITLNKFSIFIFSIIFVYMNAYAIFGYVNFGTTLRHSIQIKLLLIIFLFTCFKKKRET